MNYKELEQRSMMHANSLALGYDRDYYDKVYNEHLIKEIKNLFKTNSLIDITENELVNLLNIYQKLGKSDLLNFLNNVVNHSSRRFDYSKLIDILVNY